MTRARHDAHSTEFGLWLREQDEISSEKGYIATNVDYIWRNYKTGNWMIIEEKRYMSTIKRWQQQIFDLLAWCAKAHTQFKGFYLIQFENTSPEDGKIFINYEEVTKQELILFLQFANKQLSAEVKNDKRD